MRTIMIAGVLLCLSVQAQAQESQPQPALQPVSQLVSQSDAQPAPVQPQAAGVNLPAPEVSLFGKPEDAEHLARMRGGADTTLNDMKLDGIVTGNVASNVASGSNIIDGGSFTNSVGLPTVIQNSGANVLIQNATIVNVQLQ